MSDDQAKTDVDRQRLLVAQQRGRLATWLAYSRLSGPGWLQSAMTLGAGSLASSLFLGVIGGFSLLWVQPLAMVLGIVMLSGIAYVTLSTGERPFHAINRHVSPVLGWSWALAALAANLFWCLPQYALATGVLEQNLMPGTLGEGGAIVQAVSAVVPEQSWLALNAGRLVIVGTILIATTIVTWSYDSGRWGIKVYELILKLMVAGIVICFFGVIWMLAGELDWGSICGGFVPRFSSLFEPSSELQEVLQASSHASVWTTMIANEQREIMIGAAASAVGINMTFLFPYSLLAKGWTREFRGLAVFDLATGMLIPFLLATSCVVIASADRFHARPVANFLGRDSKATARYYELLTPIIKQQLGPDKYGQLAAARESLGKALAALPVAERERLAADDVEQLRQALSRAALQNAMDQLPEADRQTAAMLIRRSPFDLAKSLQPLAGPRVANVVFGLGVLGITLSTITILMLVSGFVICEIFHLAQGGWAHRFGCLAAATGVLGPFVWSKAAFYLAVYVSVFGMMLLPIAYLSFLFLMNRPRLLGADMPRGGRRVLWNSLLLLAAGVATAASVYSIWKRAGRAGIIAIVTLLAAALLVQFFRWMRRDN